MIHYFVVDKPRDAFYLLTRPVFVEGFEEFSIAGRGLDYKWSQVGVLGIGELPRSFDHLFRNNSAIRATVDNDYVNGHGKDAVVRGIDPFVVMSEIPFNVLGEKAIPVSRSYESPLLHFTVESVPGPQSRGGVLRLRSYKGLRTRQLKGFRMKLSERERYQVFERDNFTCQLCGASRGEPGVKLHVGHKRSVLLGGTAELENLHTLCETCNTGQQADSFE